MQGDKLAIGGSDGPRANDIIEVETTAVAGQVRVLINGVALGNGRGGKSPLAQRDCPHSLSSVARARISW